MKHTHLFALLICGMIFALGCQLMNMFAAAPEDGEEMVAEEENEFELPTRVALPVELTPMPTLIVPAKTPTRQVSVGKSPTSKTTPTRPAVGPTLPALSVRVPTVSATTAPIVIKAGSSFVPPPPPCRYANAKITFPSTDRTVSGVIEILGTANRPDLKLWRIEYRPASTSAFTELNKSDKGITNATLARMPTKNLPNGTYWLRLSVLGKEHVFVAPCQTRFKIAN